MVKKRVRKVAEEIGLEQTIEREAASTRFDRLRKVAASFKGFRHQSEVLTLVRAVPTIFASFDQATRVGGLPTERVTLLHGESAGGKTGFALGLIRSFLARDHLAYLIDAERTTPTAWVKASYGELANHPFFFADRPDTYEEIRGKVRAFCSHVRDQREKGNISPATTAIIVLDSIRKLIPAEQFKMIMIEAEKLAKGIPVEQARTRIAQIKAAMNAAWLDELIPLLEKSGVALVVIAREIQDTENPGGVITTGGRAWFYDASLDLRTSKAGPYGRKIGGDGKEAAKDDRDAKWDIWGRRYRLEITKTKVSGEGEDYRATCFFHVSNGKKTPKGFDFAKDVFELGKKSEVISTAGGWYKFGSKKWQGEERALKALWDEGLRGEIEARSRAKFVLEETRA
jgi:RecA/RadA recombinase